MVPILSPNTRTQGKIFKERPQAVRDTLDGDYYLVLSTFTTWDHLEVSYKGNSFSLESIHSDLTDFYFWLIDGLNAGRPAKHLNAFNQWV